MSKEKLDPADYDVFIVDLDGVLVRSSDIIPGVEYGVEKLRELGKLVILSNNSTRSRKEFSKKLKDFGLDIIPEHIVNSAFVVSRYLKQKSGLSSVFTIGERGLKEELELIGHRLVEPRKSDFLVVGMDREFNYEKLDNALQALVGGAEFVGTNSDGTFPVLSGQAPGAGAMVGAIEGMGFSPAEIVGKPSPIALKVAMETAGIDHPNRCLLIGDRLETDILGANRVGMDSLLVLTGVSTRKNLKEGKIVPTWVKESLSSLFEADRKIA